MRALLPLLLLLMILALCPGTALAARSFYYVGTNGGLVLLEEIRNVSRFGRFKFKVDPGFMAAGTAGLNLERDRQGWQVGRLELEGAYRRSSIERVEFAGGSLPAEGEIVTYSLMFNAFVEHRGDSPWVPYIGGGLGLARISLKGVRAGGNELAKDNDLVFAWQAGAGLGLVVSRRLAFELGYRYFSAHEPRFHDAQGGSFGSEYDAHNLLLGMRLRY